MSPVSEINLNPAYDEVPYVLDGLNIESGEVERAGELLSDFIERASAFIGGFPEVNKPAGLLAEAVRKFDIRIPLDLLRDLGEVPGLAELVQRYQSQLGELRDFGDNDESHE